MRKCGFHAQATSPQLREAILAVQPTVIVSLAHDRDFWWDIKRNLPEVFLIGRRYEEKIPWWTRNPGGWAEQCAALEMPYDAFITYNEPKGIYNEITMELAAQHDDWCCRFRQRMVELGYEAVALNVPTGHFHRNAVANLFPNICQSFQYIGLHEYSARAMWDQDPEKKRALEEVPKNEGDLIGRWYCQRYRDWYKGIVQRWPERADKVKMVVTECGIAYGVIPGFGDVGWQTDLSVEQYMASLRWYFEEMNPDDYCLGGAIFMMGFADHKWASFETLPEWRRLLKIPEVAEGPSPPEEPEEEMDIKIYDFDHSPGPDAPTVDWDWVRDTFGDVQIHPIEEKITLQEGDVVYKLVYLDARIGDANIIINVRDEHGNPVNEEVVLFGWPDAPAHGLPDKPSNWTESGVPGDTNVNGDVGPGLGKGAYYSPADGERGPHWIWVYGRPSDFVDGLGMLPGTNHAHLNLGYRAMVVGHLPPPTEGELEVVEVLIVEGTPSNMLYIAYPAEMAMDTDVHASSDAEDDIDTSPLEGFTYAGRDFALGGVCADFKGESPRTYRLFAFRLDDPGEPITPTVSYTFQPLGAATQEHVTIVVDWKEQPSPPPSGDLKERVADLEQAMADLRADVKAALGAAAERI